MGSLAVLGLLGHRQTEEDSKGFLLAWALLDHRRIEVDSKAFLVALESDSRRPTKAEKMEATEAFHHPFEAEHQPSQKRARLLHLKLHTNVKIS
mgnify:CR=1 FL=1